MAFILVPSSGNTPAEMADWGKINNLVYTIGLNSLTPVRVEGSFIIRGSVIFLGGSYYVADSDTAISGESSLYVKLTSTGGNVSASFAANLSGVSWNRQYNAWYNPSGELYIFDEMKAFASGAISRLYSKTNWEPHLSVTKILSGSFSDTQFNGIFRKYEKTTLTGSGNYTVPVGVRQLKVKMIGPGDAGQGGGYNSPGDGGASGEELEFYLDVVPGQVIAYAVTATATVFGSTTALKGKGYLGGRGCNAGQTYGNVGGNGGGYKAGAGGGRGRGDVGMAATDGYGGGGGGGAATISPVAPNNAGGAGALGAIILQ